MYRTLKAKDTVLTRFDAGFLIYATITLCDLSAAILWLGFAVLAGPVFYVVGCAVPDCVRFILNLAGNLNSYLGKHINSIAEHVNVS